VTTPRRSVGNLDTHARGAKRTRTTTVLSSDSVAVFKLRLKTFLFSQAFSPFSAHYNTLPGLSASEVTTLRRYTNLFIIIIIIRNRRQAGRNARRTHSRTDGQTTRKHNASSSIYRDGRRLK